MMNKRYPIFLLLDAIYYKSGNLELVYKEYDKHPILCEIIRDRALDAWNEEKNMEKSLRLYSIINDRKEMRSVKKDIEKYPKYSEQRDVYWALLEISFLRRKLEKSLSFLNVLDEDLIEKMTPVIKSVFKSKAEKDRVCLELMRQCRNVYKITELLFKK